MTRLLLPLLLAAASARAEPHAVTIRNGAGETISGIYFGADHSSRLRSTLPPGAIARITYSTGCTATVRIAYASGRTELHPGVEVCADPAITAGQGGDTGPPMAAASRQATVKSGAKPTLAAATPAKPALPAVPPWSGRSITKRFGGLD